MNRFSRTITAPKSQGASQAMLYALNSGLPLSAPHIGVACVWYDGNPCNSHLLAKGLSIRDSLRAVGMNGFAFGTPAVSDGISMGTHGMRYSLQSRDLIADSVESVVAAHWLDGVVVVPGCDKNMPGTLIALGRLDRPSMMVYGGTIRPGKCSRTGGNLDVVSAFQAYGEYLKAGSTPEAEAIRLDTIKNSCPGPGACGGMYTANTMASAAEALGMCLPGSSSLPAEYKEKQDECLSVGEAMQKLLKENITPKQIMTKAAFENAITLVMVLGGSTNAVLHLLAIAHSVGVDLTIDDFQRISDKIPFLADLKPSGKYVMEDVHTKLGGIPNILSFLIKHGMVNGNTRTITGLTLGENIERWQSIHGSLPENQDLLRPISNPIKKTGHIRILKGNLAPGGAVSKITGKEGLKFTGPAHVFDDEDSFVAAVESGTRFKVGTKAVVVLRYLGPKGGPGMPEMLKPTSLIMGAGLGADIACLTDGRFSGGSHGFVVGHVVPEAFLGGPIALVKDGDIITIDAVSNTLDVDVSSEELERRRGEWVQPPPRVSSGTLYKYMKVVSNASTGCITDGQDSHALQPAAGE